MSLESNYIIVIQKSFQNEKICKINIFQLGEGIASKIQAYWINQRNPSLTAILTGFGVDWVIQFFATLNILSPKIA